MNARNKRQGAWLVLAVGVIVSALTLSATAQVQTDTYAQDFPEPNPTPS
jgi:hypothetical protein